MKISNEEIIQVILSNYPDERYARLREAVDLALVIIKKQIPTKPIYERWAAARCPTCGEELSEHLGDGYYKHWESLRFCECGQKLDWSESE